MTRVAIVILSTSLLQAGPDFVDPTLDLTFRWIPAGTFLMGSPASEPMRGVDETLHRVRLSRGFHLAATEVTQGQWRKVMGANPSYHQDCGARCPVENVSYFEVEEFIERLNAMSAGSVFRLPTEAEWEYACRAGTTTLFNTGDVISTDDALFDGRTPMPGSPRGQFITSTMPVAGFKPNPWGLHDMHGSVWEWTSDWHAPYPSGDLVDPKGPRTGVLKVIRGGSWYFGADSARSALRYTHEPKDKGFSLGFRLVREPR